MAASRLALITSHLTSSRSSSVTRRDKTWDNLPTFDELPKFHEFSGCAWSVWGEGDQFGTVNLLTKDVVREAAKLVK